MTAARCRRVSASSSPPGSTTRSGAAQLQTAAANLGGTPVDGPCDEGCACLTDTAGTGESAPIPVVFGTRGDPAIACTLPAGEVDGRVKDWQTVLDHVTGRERTPDGSLRLSLDGGAPLGELGRLAVAEQGCCAFFSFAITVDSRGVALEVRAPEDAADLVAAVFGVAA